MKETNWKRRLSAAVTMGVLLASVSSVHAHGGLSFEKDLCKLKIGSYLMHFTGFLPEKTGSKEFCEDIPQTGRAIVVLDYVDVELRKMPVEIRIIKDTGDESKLDDITAYHRAAKVYPNGSIDFELTFGTPGKFIGIVSVGDGGQQIARFPFEVGRNRTAAYLISGTIGISLICAGVAGIYSVRRRRVVRGNGDGLSVQPGPAVEAG
jgi:hypothetical protein